MNDIKSIGLSVSVMMVLMAYLKQVIPEGRMSQLMKAFLSVFIMLSVVNGIRSFDFNALKNFFEQTYTSNDAVWKNAAKLIEDGLKREFETYLSEENFQVEVSAVRVDVNEDQFIIKKVILSGTDAENARTLLAGRYQIGIAYIEVKNE